MNDKFEVGKENARYLKKILLKSHLDRITIKKPDDCHIWEGRTLINVSAIINALANEENAESIIGNLEERLSFSSTMELYNKTKNEELKDCLSVLPGMKDELTYDEKDKLSIECQFGFLTMPIFYKIWDENYTPNFQYEENGYIFDFEIIAKDSEIGSHKYLYGELQKEIVKVRYLNNETYIQYREAKDIIRYIIDNGIIGQVNLNQIKQMVDIIKY